jgi:UDP-galactopyranose mutase
VSRDLVCFSHLRWDFVYQRPNHLMARAAQDRRVFFVEEPLPEAVAEPRLRLARRGRVTVVTPVVPEGLAEVAVTDVVRGLVDELVRSEHIVRPVLWFYTPMALPWSRHLAARAGAVVYDSMDFLAGFLGAPPELLQLERELLDRADLVFCGGASLHQRMRKLHADSHCFPSSVDVAHFRTARDGRSEPADLAAIGRPRLGYAGVLDERVDLELIRGVADARPEVEIVLVGPITKIDPADIPDRPNIHLLGLKPYDELPAYLGGWDVGWMPFARNDATRYISPTKTPEYLAAGLPVVSTAIHDVVDPYARNGLVAIADTVEDTVAAVDAALAGAVPELATVDAFLSSRSWDRTWASMAALVEDRLAAPARVAAMAPSRGRPAWSGVAGTGLRRIAPSPTGSSVSLAVTKGLRSGSAAGARTATPTSPGVRPTVTTGRGAEAD